MRTRRRCSALCALLLSLASLALAWLGLVLDEGVVMLSAQHQLHRMLSACCEGKARFAPDAVLPWARSLRSGWSDIRDELLAWERAVSHEVATSPEVVVPSFGDVDAEQTSFMQPAHCWRTLWLVIYGHTTACAAAFPMTMSLLRAAGSGAVTSAMFSILPPGCSIRAHRGENKAVLRYHLGIDVPAGDEPLERASMTPPADTSASSGPTAPTCCSTTPSVTR